MIDNPGPWITNFASLHHFRRRILLLPSFPILLVLLGIWISIVDWITPEFTLLIVKSSISVYHHWLNQFLLEFIARYWSILMLPAPWLCLLSAFALGSSLQTHQVLTRDHPSCLLDTVIAVIAMLLGGSSAPICPRQYSHTWSSQAGSRASSSLESPARNSWGTYWLQPITYPTMLLTYSTILFLKPRPMSTVLPRGSAPSRTQSIALRPTICKV